MFVSAGSRSERGGDAPQAKKRLRQIQIFEKIARPARLFVNPKIGSAIGPVGMLAGPINKACDWTGLCNHSQSNYVHANMIRIPASTWAEIRTAYASGIGLRELARFI